MVGASIMKHFVSHFDGSEQLVDQITIPGWICTPENVPKMVEEVEAKAPDTCAFVFDLLGNSSQRFEQFDGTTLLPFKSNGIFHFCSKDVVASPEVFRKWWTMCSLL